MIGRSLTANFSFLEPMIYLSFGFCKVMAEWTTLAITVDFNALRSLFVKYLLYAEMNLEASSLFRISYLLS
jgi:hypothetical protein